MFTNSSTFRNAMLVFVLTLLFIFLSFPVSSMTMDENVDLIEIQCCFSESFSSTSMAGIRVDQLSQLPCFDHNQMINDICIPVKPLRILLPFTHRFESCTVECTSDPVVYKILNDSSLCLQNTSLVVSHQKSDLIDIETIQRMHGYDILYLTVRPIQFQIENNRIAVYPDLELNINTVKDNEHLESDSTYVERDRIMSLVDNPEMISTYPYNEYECSRQTNIEYVIITNNEFARVDQEFNFQRLMYEKNINGVSTALITVEEIIQNASFHLNGMWGDNNPLNPFFQESITKNHHLFNDTAAKIRNFIRYAYMQWGTRYVLLGGDGDVNSVTDNIIPARGLFANESGLPLIINNHKGEEEDDIPSDVYYACLDGNFNFDMDDHFGESPDRNDREEFDEADLLAEVYVGRACIDSSVELSNFVRKTIQYEYLHHPYFEEILFVGEHLGFPGISVYGGNYKDELLYLIPEEYELSQLYDRDIPYGWKKDDIIQVLNNQTPHIINHNGHSYYGYNLKMYMEDVDRLTNDQPFFLYSHGCMAGGFDYPFYDCIGERFTVESAHGAFAAILNSRYGLGSENSLDSPSLALDESFFKALFVENIRQIGPANHFSKEDHIWHINENGIRWVIYETNLFGDPMVSIKDADQPPVDVTVHITSPQTGGMLYINNEPWGSLPWIHLPVILGSVTVEAEVVSVPKYNLDTVEFFIDDQLIGKDDDAPFLFTIDRPLLGKHTVSVVATGYQGETAVDTLDMFFIMF